MKYSEEMKQVREETARNRGRFIPTQEMADKRKAYFAMLEARKRGETPLYVSASGKRYG